MSPVRDADLEDSPRPRRHVPVPALPAAAKGTDSIGVIPAPGRPTRDELQAAYGKAIPDVIAPGLDVLFVGINPSLWSGAVGLHFARPGNRFWRALHEAGFTDRLLSPYEGRELLKRKIGVTNLVNKATASADELDTADYQRGARRIASKVRRYRPKVVAFVGMGAYRVAFRRPRARGGPQEERLGGAAIWVLPNPSGRTAGYQMPALAGAFRALRRSL
jgi:TDG/mug DNA glycosylase family protein